MKRIILPLMLAALCSSGCIASIFNRGITPSDNTVTYTENIGPFHEIEVAQATVNHTLGTATGTVTITVAENLRSLVQVRVVEGTLKIRFREGTNLNNFEESDFVVEITAPAAKEYEAVNSAKITVGGVVNGHKLDVEANTSATVNFESVQTTNCDLEANTSAQINIGNLECNQVEADANTSAMILLSAGRADRAEFEASTSGSINAENIPITTGKAEASTSGSIKCRIENAHTIRTSTGGTIINNGTTVN